jgi:MFS family permease
LELTRWIQYNSRASRSAFLPEPSITASAPPPQPTHKFAGFEWPSDVTPAERKTLIAGGLGWMLDAMDVVLYSLVLADLTVQFGMSKGTAGLLNSITLASSAVGGLLFGFLADRIGRTRALMISILAYSMATAACGFSQTVLVLAVLRCAVGLGMGGEWTTGAALIAETWRAEHRGKALGLMQSSYAIGEMIAVAVVFLVLPRFGWRAVFFVGICPALIVFWILHSVPESEIWRKGARRNPPLFARLWQKDLRRDAIFATAMNACGMFGYWGLFTWIPGYLSLPVARGGRGFALATSTEWLLVMGVGKWFGYALFGFAADAFGRRRSYVVYLLMAALLVPLYGNARNPLWLLLLGPFVAFFGTGFFSGFSALAAELFPTEIRATAMGLSYNLGRGLSALAPFVVGAIADRYGFQAGFYLLAGAFFIAALLALALPETRGRQLS